MNLSRILFLMAGTLAPLLLLAGCSNARSTLQPPETMAMRSLFIPAGVDSTVAAYADSLAGESFVDLDAQEAATVQREEAAELTAFSDSLWAYLEMGQDSAGSVDATAAQAALRAANEAVGPLNELIQITNSSQLDDRAMLERQEALLNQAQDALEQSIRLNPFDLQTRGVLARVYTAQAQRLGKLEAYEASADVLEKLVRLRPDQHTLFIALANNYYQLKRWDDAVYNYERAEYIYLQTYDLVAENPPPAPDAPTLYQYITRQADVHVWRRDSESALTAYERALDIAPNEEETSFIKSEIEWINWDDGNIASSMARDSLIGLEQGGQLFEAENGYMRLMNQVRKPAAVDETEWRLAALQYRNGKGDEAATRLQAIINRSLLDPSTGMPVDSTYQRYFDTYGTVCFNQAMLYLGEKRDNRTALKYLEQATQFAWKDRPRAYLETAKLLRSNVREAKRRAEAALTEVHLLATEDQKELFGLLATLYRTEGNFDQARQYLERYRAIQ